MHSLRRFGTFSFKPLINFVTLQSNTFILNILVHISWQSSFAPNILIIIRAVQNFLFRKIIFFPPLNQHLWLQSSQGWKSITASTILLILYSCNDSLFPPVYLSWIIFKIIVFFVNCSPNFIHWWIFWIFWIFSIFFNFFGFWEKIHIEVGIVTKSENISK